MTFWGGSGSSDPCFWLMDPDPAIFVIDLQDDSKNYFLTQFFCLLLFECTFTSFFKDKCQKESQNRRNQSFSYYFCMMIEGSGSIPLTSGSGSTRPKNMWIRNTALQYFDLNTRLLLFDRFISYLVLDQNSETVPLSCVAQQEWSETFCRIQNRNKRFVTE